MYSVNCRNHPNWLSLTLQAVRTVGFMIVEDVLNETMLEETRNAMYSVRRRILEEIEPSRRQSEVGVLRLMMRYDAHFIKFLELPELLEVVDNALSPTAVLHLQNGLILAPNKADEITDVFQTRYHMDFPRVNNGYFMSINALFMIDDFTKENGATFVVPGSHQMDTGPSKEYMETFGVQAEGKAGSMIVFDSTLWHAAGQNISAIERKGINHQFTRSYLKQQVDYVRALGEENILKQHERTQQLLGYYTRVVTSLDEYYQPPEKRLYRSGQG